MNSFGLFSTISALFLDFYHKKQESWKCILKFYVENTHKALIPFKRVVKEVQVVYRLPVLVCY